MIESTLIIVKPEGVARGLVGNIIARFERKGLKISGLKMIRIDKDLAMRHYGEHKGKPFFEGLVNHITSSPIVVGVVEGDDVVRVVRSMCGTTNPKDAPPGTIRGDYGMEIGKNVIHASDSPESAKREINLFFDKEEILSN